MRQQLTCASLALAAALFALAACTAAISTEDDSKAAAAKDRLTLVYYNIPG